MTQLYGMSSDSATKIIELTAKTRGTLGELTVAGRLQREGWNVRRQREGSKEGDLLVSMIRYTDKPQQIFKSVEITQRHTIEVKTAFRGSRGTFQFCLFREDKPGTSRGATDCHHADFVMLLAVEDDYSVVAFMIPSSALTQKKLEFRDPLLCKWRKYLLWQ